ncbi:hypothetical protein BDV96DRAFT_216500 [Lophiotrema nucula]|uniref:Uncharacterized protein n=1 Tax=Lophiotrema nucula TaxID=690887 RepID=A0A6A5ZQX2_9PLEO|nr:hypothetical protein BDV96DRAFT_216500 [Lophiotrema nucula]
MEEFSRGCDGQLKVSEDIIKSAQLKGRVEKIIDESKKKLSKDGVIYWTGYAKFFDEDMADDDYCSKPENTWSLFLSVSEHLHLLRHPPDL